MTHVDEGALLALADGEMDLRDAEGVERHLELCGDCREELERIRDASLHFRAALESADVPAPQVSDIALQAVRRRAANGGSRPVAGWRDVRRAAVLVLGFAAAASATIPGSPVNRWIRDLTQPRPQVAEVREAGRDVPAMTAAPPAGDRFVAETGVSVLPENGEVHVVLRGATSELRVKAVLVEEARAGVFAAGAASSARFSTAPGRIEVSGAAAGELRIELPQAARAASVEVNGRRYITKEGEQLRLTVPAEESAGAEVSFRVLQ